MLDDWVGDRGRVPLERLAPALHDAAVAPKMSPEGRTAAIAWLGGALAAEQVRMGWTLLHRCGTHRCSRARTSQGHGSNYVPALMCSANPGVLQGAKSLDTGMRVAVFAAADKSSEVREGGNTLVKRMVEVCSSCCNRDSKRLRATVQRCICSLLGGRPQVVIHHPVPCSCRRTAVQLC